MRLQGLESLWKKAPVMQLNRLEFLASSGTLVVNMMIAHTNSSIAVASMISPLESESGAKIGMSAIETITGKRIGYRDQQPFPMASTVKLLVVMATLQRVDRGLDSLDTVVPFSSSDLVQRFSAIATDHPNGGALSLRTICALTISESDNTGVDLLFKRIGGPPPVDAYIRELGIAGIRVDRTERQLPEHANAGERRDSATPFAMASVIHRIVVGSSLCNKSKHTLLGWMMQTKTGRDRIRAVIPSSWRLAHKTGTYSNVVNDIGAAFPPSGHPIALAVFVEDVDVSKGSLLCAGAARIGLQALRQARSY